MSTVKYEALVGELIKCVNVSDVDSGTCVSALGSAFINVLMQTFASREERVKILQGLVHEVMRIENEEVKLNEH